MSLKPTIESLTIKGFKSIRSLENFKPEQLNVLIGPNGAGKSNFIGFFRMMSWMCRRNSGLQAYLAKYGGAQAHLFGGADITQALSASMTLKTAKGFNRYALDLDYGAGDLQKDYRGDTLIIASEKIQYSAGERDALGPAYVVPGKGWLESRVLHDDIIGGDVMVGRTARVMKGLLQGIQPYQFHNTSFTASIRSSRYKTDDSEFLREDAGNLGAYLLRMKQEKPEYFSYIEDLLRDIFPFFAEFSLRADDAKNIPLQWKERDMDMVCHAHQASDGTLRAMAAVVLLAQPPEWMSDVVFLDEPELGLHPQAIELIGGLLQEASQHQQIFVATQSPILISTFKPKQAVVVERNKSSNGTGWESVYRQLDQERLSGWLEDYNGKLGTLWTKNVLGGNP